jgi:aspartate dehydrogenase
VHLLRIGLLGFGIIGRGVAEAIRDGRAGQTQLVAALVRTPSRVGQEAVERYGFRLMTDPADFLDSQMDLVVEVAGHEALKQYGEWVLRADKNLMVISVGAFADEEFFSRVRQLAHERGKQVLIPSGAISGLDGVSAAAMAEVESVTHTTRKHPRAFTAEQLGGESPSEAKVLFDGPAQQGVRLFPENVNVAAAVSLAGIGLARTRLRVIADPAVQRNVQRIELKGWCGEITVLQQNIPTENPKTGRIVALSVAKALRNLSAPVVVGL